MKDDPLDGVAVANLCYTNPLITCEQATLRGRSAWLLRAPPLTAPALEQARVVLTELAAQAARVSGYPTISRHGVDRGGRFVLLLNATLGQSMQAYRNAGEFPTEDELISFITQYTHLVAALHQLGYSGLRPTLDELIWHRPTPLLTVLGWERVRPRTAEHDADLRPALAGWLECALGAPPRAALTVEHAPPHWQQLSLALRTLLVDWWALRRDLTVDDVISAVGELQRLRQAPATLLPAAQRLEQSEPQRALLYYDLLARAAASSKEIAEAQRTGAVAQASLQAKLPRSFNDQSKPGHQALSEGYHHKAVAPFAQLAEHSDLTPAQRLQAIRWHCVAQTLSQAVKVGGFSDERPLIKTFEPVLKAAIEQANGGALRGQAAKLTQSRREHLPAHIKWPELDSLIADLHIHELVNKAYTAERSQKSAGATRYWVQAAELAAKVHYRVQLEAVLGNLALRAQQAKKEQEMATTMQGKRSQAERELAKGNFPAARAAADAAQQLATDPADIAACLRLQHCATLCQQAVEAGVRSDPLQLSEQEQWRAVQALRAILQEFPDEGWALGEAARWRVRLFNSTLESHDVDLSQLIGLFVSHHDSVRDELLFSAATFHNQVQTMLRSIAASKHQADLPGLVKHHSHLRLLRTYVVSTQTWFTAANVKNLEDVAQEIEQALSDMDALIAQQRESTLVIITDDMHPETRAGAVDAKLEDLHHLSLHLDPDAYFMRKFRSLIERLPNCGYKEAQRLLKNLKDSAGNENLQAVYAATNEYVKEYMKTRNTALKRELRQLFELDKSKRTDDQRDQANKLFALLEQFPDNKGITSDLQQRVITFCQP